MNEETIRNLEITENTRIYQPLVNYIEKLLENGSDREILRNIIEIKKIVCEEINKVFEKEVLPIDILQVIIEKRSAIFVNSGIEAVSEEYQEIVNLKDVKTRIIELEKAIADNKNTGLEDCLAESYIEIGEFQKALEIYQNIEKNIEEDVEENIEEKVEEKIEEDKVELNPMPYSEEAYKKLIEKMGIIQNELLTAEDFFDIAKKLIQSYQCRRSVKERNLNIFYKSYGAEQLPNKKIRELFGIGASNLNATKQKMKKWLTDKILNLYPNNFRRVDKKYFYEKEGFVFEDNSEETIRELIRLKLYYGQPETVLNFFEAMRHDFDITSVEWTELLKEIENKINTPQELESEPPTEEAPEATTEKKLKNELDEPKKKLETLQKIIVEQREKIKGLESRVEPQSILVEFRYNDFVELIERIEVALDIPPEERDFMSECNVFFEQITNKKEAKLKIKTIDSNFLNEVQKLISKLIAEYINKKDVTKRLKEILSTYHFGKDAVLSFGKNQFAEGNLLRAILINKLLKNQVQCLFPHIEDVKQIDFLYNKIRLYYLEKFDTVELY